MWTAVGSESFTAADRGRYKFIVLPDIPGVVAFGISMAVPSSQASTRRRVAFCYPFVAVDDRQLVGPDSELFAAFEGQPPAIHLLAFDWLEAYSGLTGRVAAYAAAVSVDRGAVPSSATVWALT